MATIQKLIDIIIPTKDNDSDLEECLNSLVHGLSFNNEYEYNVIIIREHKDKRVSSDFFTLINAPKYKDLNISYAVIKKAIGFTKAVNTGIKISLAKKKQPNFIAFLHDDTIIFKGWLEALIDPMIDNIGIFGTGSITINELDDQCITKCYNYFNFKQDNVLLQDLFNEFYEVTPSNNLHIANKVKNLKFYEFKEETNLSKISLFSSLFRTDAFKKFGLFDENLISSFKVEDEFCKRLLDNKKTVALVPQAFVLHKCNSFTFQNKNLADDKLLRIATLDNIKIKRNVNPIRSKKRKQYVVYTYLTSEQTSILNNLFGFHDLSNTDFYCFTDRDKFESDAWNIINISKFKEVNYLSRNNNNLKEFIKLHPHYFFKNYNASIWIDFDDINMIPFNTQEFIRLMDEKTTTIALEDKLENCSWKYLIKNYKEGKISNNLYEAVLSTYRFYNMPANIGFMNTSILARQHNEEDCINLMENRWKQYINVASDDKYWFNFIYWLYKKSYYSIPYNLYQLEMNNVIKRVDKMKKEQLEEAEKWSPQL